MAHAADYVINYSESDFAKQLETITKGEKVDVVYDSVGKDTYLGSLKCLKPRGLLVSFGQSSGAIGAFDPLLLSQYGSLYLSRPRLADYTATQAELNSRAAELFTWVDSGALKVLIGATFDLSQASLAHQAIESRKTVGKIILNIN